MRCAYQCHGDVHDFPDDEFEWEDGRCVHEVAPRHTIEGQPLLSSTDAVERPSHGVIGDIGEDDPPA
ncbi:MAG TPA: hypothetical protein VHR16_01620 [Candidatus Limnocylindrales bacterium]|nr:hypothetical protein [Candidatus Limnocylindrales bacterium]